LRKSKPKTRDSALPRKRSAPALALQSARHRQRVIPDKRAARHFTRKECEAHLRHDIAKAAALDIDTDVGC
jgi:hypothetical protein